MDIIPIIGKIAFAVIVLGVAAIFIKTAIDRHRFFKRRREQGGERHSAAGGMSSGDTSSIDYGGGDS